MSTAEELGMTSWRDLVQRWLIVFGLTAYDQWNIITTKSDAEIEQEERDFYATVVNGHYETALECFPDQAESIRFILLRFSEFTIQRRVSRKTRKYIVNLWRNRADLWPSEDGWTKEQQIAIHELLHANVVSDNGRQL